MIKTDKGSRLKKTALVVLAIIWGVTTRPTPALADTVSLSPQKNNTLYEDSTGQLSNGRGIYLFTGKTANPLRRGIRWSICESGFLKGSPRRALSH